MGEPYSLPFLTRLERVVLDKPALRASAVRKEPLFSAASFTAASIESMHTISLYFRTDFKVDFGPKVKLL